MGPLPPEGVTMTQLVAGVRTVPERRAATCAILRSVAARAASTLASPVDESSRSSFGGKPASNSDVRDSILLMRSAEEDIKLSSEACSYSTFPRSISSLISATASSNCLLPSSNIDATIRLFCSISSSKGKAIPSLASAWALAITRSTAEYFSEVSPPSSSENRAEDRMPMRRVDKLSWKALPTATAISNKVTTRKNILELGL
mmetsp:Transcript_20261/g.41517  ORF Transcript_20261/g.41517 Transcript_20261/m.41517 type:complete len:203 (-) Transcript_20261:110-718(-)